MGRHGQEDGVRSPTIVVTVTPGPADGGYSSLTVAATSFRDKSTDGDVVAVSNATNVDLYFRTAYLLHYASIVILGLFVLQVTH